MTHLAALFSRIVRTGGSDATLRLKGAAIGDLFGFARRVQAAAPTDSLGHLVEIVDG